MAEHRQHPDPELRDGELDEPATAARTEKNTMPKRESVATLLRRTREQQGRQLSDVAATLNIRYVYLEAIEEGEFNKLPGTTYAIGFLRGFAEYLGLDHKEIVHRFKAEVAGLDKQTQLVFPTPVPEGKVPGGALIFVSVLCLTLAYGAWSLFSDQDTQVAELVPVVPERLQNLIDEEQKAVTAELDEHAPADQSSPRATDLPEVTAAVSGAGGGGDQLETTTVGSAQFESAPVEAARVESVPVEADSPEPPGQSVATPAQPDAPASEPASERNVEAARAPASSQPDATQVATFPALPSGQVIPAAPVSEQAATVPSTPVPKVYGRENVGYRVSLHATQDSWVQVRNAQDDLLLTRVLRAGDSYRVPNQPGLILRTGNAGGLTVKVDGKKIGPVGPVGAVRRNVVLDPDRLLEGSALRQ